MPVIAPSQAAATPGPAADAAAEGDGTADFAAVLKAQIARPAKDAPGTENIAALLPVQAAEAAEEALSANALPAAPDLSALLPALAGLMPQTPTQAADPQPQAAEPAAVELSAHAAVAASPVAASHALPAQEADASVAEATPPEAQAAGRPAIPSSPSVQIETAADVEPPAATIEQAQPAAQTHAAAPPAHAAAAGNAPSVVRVGTPVGARGWDAEVGQKIVLLANRQESRAELTLTPPQLGRVEVTISVSGDQTSAAFVSASPAAREALEQALPRLREILAEAGITLGQASVNAESPRQDRESTPGGERAGEGNGRSDERAVAPAQMHWLRRSEGLVDTFA
jgi:flagellar hook-length control protein FliK